MCSSDLANPYPTGVNVAWSSPHFADIDNDGDYDLLLCCGAGYYSTGDAPTCTAVPELWINDGAGNFAKSTTALPTMTNTHRVCAVGDLDNDGLLDIIVGDGGSTSPSGQGGTKILFYKQGSNGVFIALAGGAAPPFSTATATRVVVGLELADYNNDGALDLAVANGAKSSGGSWSYLANEVYKNSAASPGTFTLLDTTNFPGTPTVNTWDTRTVAWGDYDGDGKLDLFFGNKGALNELYHNDGGDVFTAVERQAPTSPFADTFAAAFGDLDNDGDADLLIGNAGTLTARAPPTSSTS